MRAGDILLLAIIAASLGAIAADGATGGALQAWAGEALPALASRAGIALGWIGWALSPLLFLPLLIAVWAGAGSPPGGLTRIMRGLVRAVEAVTVAVGDAARWFALALVLVTATIVIQRYVFGYSSTKLQESVIYLHALLFLLSAAATLLAGGHVRVDIIYSKLSERGRAWTDIAGAYLALIPMCWLILITSRGYVGGAWRILEKSRESDGLPLVFALKTAIPVFAVMLAAQGAAMAARAALKLAGEREPSKPAAADAEL